MEKIEIEGQLELDLDEIWFVKDDLNEAIEQMQFVFKKNDKDPLNSLLVFLDICLSDTEKNKFFEKCVSEEEDKIEFSLNCGQCPSVAKAIKTSLDKKKRRESCEKSQEVQFEAELKAIADLYMEDNYKNKVIKLILLYSNVDRIANQTLSNHQGKENCIQKAKKNIEKEWGKLFKDDDFIPFMLEEHKSIEHKLKVLQKRIDSDINPTVTEFNNKMDQVKSALFSKVIEKITEEKNPNISPKEYLAWVKRLIDLISNQILLEKNASIYKQSLNNYFDLIGENLKKEENDTYKRNDINKRMLSQCEILVFILNAIHNTLNFDENTLNTVIEDINRLSLDNGLTAFLYSQAIEKLPIDLNISITKESAEQSLKYMLRMIRAVQQLETVKKQPDYKHKLEQYYFNLYEIYYYNNKSFFLGEEIVKKTNEDIFNQCNKMIKLLTVVHSDDTMENKNHMINQFSENTSKVNKSLEKNGFKAKAKEILNIAMDLVDLFSLFKMPILIPKCLSFFRIDHKKHVASDKLADVCEKMKGLTTYK